MKRPITTNACYLGSMLLGVGALLCASGIENSTNGWAMLGWTMIALALGGVALILAAWGSLQGSRPPSAGTAPMAASTAPTPAPMSLTTGRTGGEHEKEPARVRCTDEPQR